MTYTETKRCLLYRGDTACCRFFILYTSYIHTFSIELLFVLTEKICHVRVVYGGKSCNPIALQIINIHIVCLLPVPNVSPCCGSLSLFSCNFFIFLKTFPRQHGNNSQLCCPCPPYLCVSPSLSVSLI